MMPKIQAKFCLCLLLGLALAQDEDQAKLLENLPPPGYNKAIRPNFGGEPVTVSVTVHLVDIPEVSKKDMQFKASMYFRNYWTDPRLAFSGNQKIQLHGDQCRKFWTPDTILTNTKQINHQVFPLTGEPAEYCRVSPSGEVLMSKLISATFNCPMNLRNYPFDLQTCEIQVESYGYSTSDITYTWGPGSVGLADSVPILHFRILGFINMRKVDVLSTGNYTRLISQIKFERSAGPQIKRIYIPAFLLLVLSWFPLFITKKPEIRVCFAFFMIIAVTFFNVYITSDLPEIRYFTSAETYLTVTWILVFFTLLEAAIDAVVSTQTKFPFFQDFKDQLSDAGKWARVVIPVLGLVYNLGYVIWAKSLP